MLITVEQFKAFLPAFAGIPDATVELYIDQADPMFCAKAWGKSLVAGVSYYVAHMMVMNGVTASPDGGTASIVQGGVGVTNTRVGELSESYSDAGAIKQMDNPFMSTTYGQQYWFLKKQLFGGMVFAVCPRF